MSGKMVLLQNHHLKMLMLKVEMIDSDQITDILVDHLGLPRFIFIQELNIVNIGFLMMANHDIHTQICTDPESCSDPQDGHTIIHGFLLVL